jgi:parvulin-like peptidyl-prolyl isomerase
MTLKIIFALLLCSLGFSQPSVTIATVNNTAITYAELLSAYEASALTPSNKRVTMEATLEFLINRQLVIDKGNTLGLNKNPVIQQRMLDVLFGATLAKELEKEINQITISENEIDNYYKDNKEYRTSQILLRLPINSNKEEFLEQFNKANDFYNQIKSTPAKFDELVKKSDAQNAETGGDLGFLPSTSYVPEFFDAINNKQVGYLAPPFRSIFGYHIVKITGVKELKEIDRGLYRKILFDKKRDTVVNAYYLKLRKQSAIVINKDKLPKGQ